MNKLVVDLLQQNGYNGYNGGWPSARLFGWSAADWSRPATNKSISSERNRKSLLFCWERKSWTSWLLTCCSKKGWVAEKSSKKGVNRKEKCFLSSQTRWSWQIRIRVKPMTGWTVCQPAFPGAFFVHNSVALLLSTSVVWGTFKGVSRIYNCLNSV